MAQSHNLELNRSGLGMYKIGEKVKELNSLKKLELHPEFKKFSLPNNNTIQHYFADCSSGVFVAGAKVDYFFVAPDSNNKISYIKLFLSYEDNAKQVYNSLINVLGNPKLATNSGIGNIPTNSKFSWNVGSMIFTLTMYPNETKGKLDIYELYRPYKIDWRCQIMILNDD